MENKIRDPFKKTTNWANLATKRVEKSDKKNERKSNEKPLSRVAKSFKIYPGKISRTFDKRVNKLQVHYDDLDHEKNYVDAGKYMMFLMSFAEKYELHELYSEVDKNGDFDLESKKVKEFLDKKIS